MSLVLSLRLRVCVVLAIGLMRAGANQTPQKPGGVWVCACDKPGLSNRPYWSYWTCDDLTYSGELDYRRKFEEGSEEWAYCVTRCMKDAAASKNKVTLADKMEQLYVGVNSWLMQKLQAENTAAHQKCASLHAATVLAFSGYIEPAATTDLLPKCSAECPVAKRQLGSVAGNAAGCLLTDGHVSITPVQNALQFPVSAWRDGTTSTTVCQWCPASYSGTCVFRTENQYATASVADTTAIVSAKATPKWSEFVFHTGAVSLSNIKQHWDNYLLTPFADRVAKVSPEPMPCPAASSMGVSTSCLHNKGALVARLCDYKDTCFTQDAVFGPSSPDMQFVVRGADYVQWYIDEDACAKDILNEATIMPTTTWAYFSASHKHNVFKLKIDECESCPGENQGETNHNSVSGEVQCAICDSKIEEVVEHNDRIVCSAIIPYTECQACPAHSVRDDRVSSSGTCRPCAEFEDLRGSHRIGRDCTNCIDSKIWEESPQQCSAIPSQTFVMVGSTLQRQSTDHYKYSEYQSLAVPDLFFRLPFSGTASPSFVPVANIQSCGCDSVHKYAHHCAGYSSTDAYLIHNTDRTVTLLSSLASVTDTEDYTYLRAGLCKWCTKCSVGQYNGNCELGSAGTCSSCKNPSEQDCAEDSFLSHPHALGCEQTRARHDYTCTTCRVLVRTQGQFWLAVGCGRQELTRWLPDALSDEGKLISATCDFTNEMSSAAACSHAGVGLQQALTGSHHSLMPYCPESWFFSEECQDKLITGEMTVESSYDASCCQQCGECGGDKKKSGPNWKVCTGSTGVDTQGTFCSERCENNMYEQEDKCFYCETCNEGELP